MKDVVRFHEFISCNADLLISNSFDTPYVVTCCLYVKQMRILKRFVESLCDTKRAISHSTESIFTFWSPVSARTVNSPTSCNARFRTIRNHFATVILSAFHQHYYTFATSKAVFVPEQFQGIYELRLFLRLGPYPNSCGSF